jgi:hypothetical protein
MNKFKVTYSNDLVDIIYSTANSLSNHSLARKENVVAVAFLGQVPEGHLYLKSQVI